MKITLDLTHEDESAKLDRVLAALGSHSGDTRPKPGDVFQVNGLSYQLVARCDITEVCARLRTGWAIHSRIAADTVLFVRPVAPVGEPNPGPGMERTYIPGDAMHDDVRAALAMWTFERWAEGGGFFATRRTGVSDGK